MSERTFPQLCATVVINEIEPRAKRHAGARPPGAFVGALVALEHDKAITRKQLRRLVDNWYAEAAPA